MPRGRPKLTQREKINNKIVRLQNQIESLRLVLTSTLDGDQTTVLVEK